MVAPLESHLLLERYISTTSFNYVLFNSHSLLSDSSMPQSQPPKPPTRPLQARLGVSAGDPNSQLKEEIRHLSKEDRQNLLFSGGFTIDIPPEQGLAMKADLAIHQEASLHL
jgi:hypothetical protein